MIRFSLQRTRSLLRLMTDKKKVQLTSQTFISRLHFIFQMHLQHSSSSFHAAAAIHSQKWVVDLDVRNKTSNTTRRRRKLLFGKAQKRVAQQQQMGVVAIPGVEMAQTNTNGEEKMKNHQYLKSHVRSISY